VRSDVTLIARQLLGKRLCTRADGIVTGGLIVETEAYSEREKGCHAYKGITPRNAVMYEEGGIAYVYLCYGIHEMFNIVTNRRGKADAVLIRALEPVVGVDVIMQRMKARSEKKLTAGPGKLTKALGIDRSRNGRSVSSADLWIEEAETPEDIVCGPRIGIDYAGDDAHLPWRFSLRDNPWVSK